MKEISPHVKIKFWLWNVGAAILDQGVFSGANFVLSILYSRWVSVEIYGGFSASYSIFLLISTVQVAFIAEPMSIYGADRYSENISAYLGFLLRLQLIGSLITSLLLIFIATFIVDKVLREAMFAMSISFPFIIFFWFLRRAFYIEMQPGVALVSSMIYSALLILLASLTWILDYANSFTVYFVMALSSLVAAFYSLKKISIFSTKNKEVAEYLDSKKVTVELWGFGKWVFPAYFASWVTSLSFPFFVSLLLDVRSAGALRALQNLFLPLQQFLAAVTLLILPWLAKQWSRHGSRKLFVSTQSVAWVIGFVSLLYCFLVSIFRNELFALLYNNEFYSSFGNLTVLLAVSVLISSAPLILGLALRILDQPYMIFISKGAAVAFTVLLGFPLIRMFYMDGVMLTLIGSASFEAIFMLLYFFRIKSSSGFRF